MKIKIKNKINKHLLLLILGSVNLHIYSNEVTLVVEGIGDSKANAIIDAQRNALRTSYGEFVTSNLTTLNNELTKNETVNLVSGTIQESNILSVSENDFAIPPIFEVLMEITVNKGKLVSFAKAIGDNVEIQGSLFGAEIKQQEINKNNEIIAMNHLVEKAKIMSALFDFKINVFSPKRGVTDESNFYIYGDLELSTNHNYKELTSSILSSIKQIAMKESEKEKFRELNTPMYLARFIVVEEYDAYVGGDNYSSGKFRECANTSWASPFEEKFIACNAVLVQDFYLRSEESYMRLEEIRREIEKDIYAYEISRETNISSKKILPFLAQNDIRGLVYSKIPDVYGQPQYEEEHAAYRELILSRQTEEDKKNIDKGCTSYKTTMTMDIDLCYKNKTFSKYAREVDRIAGTRPVNMGYVINRLLSEDTVVRPLTIEECRNIYKDRQAVWPEKWGTYNGYRGSCNLYRKDRNCCLAVSSHIETTVNYGSSDESLYFFIHKNSYKFANIRFEDLVEKDTLSKITSYSVTHKK